MCIVLRSDFFFKRKVFWTSAGNASTQFVLFSPYYSFKRTRPRNPLSALSPNKFPQLGNPSPKRQIASHKRKRKPFLKKEKYEKGRGVTLSPQLRAAFLLFSESHTPFPSNATRQKFRRKEHQPTTENNNNNNNNKNKRHSHTTLVCKSKKKATQKKEK